MEEFKPAQTDEWLAVPPPKDRERANGSARSPTRAKRRGAAKLRRTAQQVETHDRDLSELRLRMEAIEARAQKAEARARAAVQRAEEAEQGAVEALRREERLRIELAEAQEALAANTEENGERIAAELRDQVDAAERRLQSRDAETRSRVDDAEMRLEEFPAKAREVEQRIKAIEERVSAAGRAVQKLAAPDAPPASSLFSSPPEPPPTAPEIEPEPRPEPGAPEPGPEDPGTSFDVNRIGFEQLREIGLSVTQAARLLASRDARGAFKSMDELNDLREFSKELIDELMRRLTLRAP